MPRASDTPLGTRAPPLGRRERRAAAKPTESIPEVGEQIFEPAELPRCARGLAHPCTGAKFPAGLRERVAARLPCGHQLVGAGLDVKLDFRVEFSFEAELAVQKSKTTAKLPPQCHKVAPQAVRITS